MLSVITQYFIMLSINMLSVVTRYAECHSVNVMPSVAMLSVVML